ncbi:hypothetical protein IPM44_04410 [bacterium]|nr:MAG: hypothetical protein IPM44_04410 [bacterium]
MIIDFLQWLWQLILGVGLTLILAYLVYMLGLGLVFRKLGQRMWPAYIPAYNYIVLIRILGLPKSWQAVAFVPYLGPIYSIPIGIRLGKIFGKSPAFSSFWLTIGAPVGMLVLAFSKKSLNLDVIKEPAPKIDTKKLKELTKKHQA